MQSSNFLAMMVIACLVMSLAASDCLAVEGQGIATVGFVKGDRQLTIAVDGMPVAMYCWQDDKILRPYFAHVRTTGGVQVTRNHPPIEGHDLPDHDTIHPGIWLAFGDISGMDFWRNVAPIRHAEFVAAPHGGPGRGTFTVRNEYLNPSDLSQVVCKETTCYTIVPHPAGYLLLWDTRFTSDKDFKFGDQEEMGLGIRVATPLRVGETGIVKAPAGSGTITNSAGAKNEEALWGDAADWCDFSGTIAGRKVGATIFCHPRNMRKSRFHARDYGMLTANPFAQSAFGKGEKLETSVRAGDALRLRFGIFIHGGEKAPDLAAVYQDYLRLAEK